MSHQHPEHLEPSKLGTKEYWDSLYTNELSNHAADPSDIGTVWFDDSDAEAKILGFLSSHFPPSVLPRDETSFLDLGCGNGSLLLSLREPPSSSSDSGSDPGDETEDAAAAAAAARRAPWTGRMLGVDYSPQSVELARQICSSRRGGDEGGAVSFAEWDVLAGPTDAVLSGAQSRGWDVVLDKGTFDAISLSDGGGGGGGGVRPCEGYKARVLPLVREGGYFLVTSCNWTEPELRAWFEGPGGFVLDGRVDYRSFSFGGLKGQTITTLCFRRPGGS